MRADIRVALRALLRTPAFTGVALLTLALGIGANTAIFTVVNTVLLRPLAYSEPDALVLVKAARANERSQTTVFSYTRLQFLQANSRSFTGLAGFTNEVFNLSGMGDPEQLPAARVSWNFFDVLGLRPIIGRSFVPTDDQPGAKDVALISHALWMRRFGGSASIVGQTIDLDSRGFTVVGVLPPGFEFALLGTGRSGAPDIWAPKVFELNLATPQQVYGGAGYLTAIARLKPGMTEEKAQAEMDVLNQAYLRQYGGRPDADRRLAIFAGNLQRELVSNIRPALLILLGAVGFILLIACSNVASLLLSRALGRRKEMAIRAALGANRRTILRQLLTESILLAAIGGAAGIGLSHLGTRYLSSLTQSTLPRVSELRMDGWVLAFTVAVSILSGVLFGLVPALQLSRADVNSMLRDEGRGSTGSRERNRTRNLLVVAEVALSMVLLLGAGLLIRSFIRLETASPGFDPSGVVTMEMSLPRARYSTPAQMVAFYNRVLGEVARTPGASGVAISSALPINPSRFTPVLFEGQPAVPLNQRPIVNIQTISPGYLHVLRVPLIAGREFTAHDDAQGPRVALVNQALARRFWANENAIGKRIWIGRMAAATEVVGVTGDVKNVSLSQDAQPEILLPFPQLPWANLNLSVRTAAGDPYSIVASIRHQVANVDKGQPVTNVQTMEEVLASARAQPRMTMLLLGIFSATALVLAVVGLYGVIGYSVAQRMREMGIRVALGATRGDILRMVVSQGVALAAIGIAIGIAASLALTRTMSSLLYQVTPSDPLTFIAGTALFALVAVMASYVPARRATRLDPVRALRGE